MFREKLLVIGAGPVGLAMAKALQTHGIAYDHVDASDGVGGNWRHGVYASAHIVSSKRTTGYADYPMPADYPDFPNAAQMLAYLESFARDAGIADRIETGREVMSARPRPDQSWVVDFADGETRIYKGVVVCNGHHWDKRWPSYPGKFTGEILHAKDYKRPAQLAGKRVLTIGGGNSGCDISCEAARVSASSDLSLRQGYWFLPKSALGRPLTDLPIWSLPELMQRLILRGLIKLVIGDYRSYGLPRPTHRLFDRHPTFGTEVLGYIQQGRIKPRPDIERYEGNQVRFKDGTVGTYDLIVAATGYNNSFPFLPEGLVEVKNGAAQIYGGAFPSKVKNLYIVGSNQPRNGFGGIITPAADLFARMIKLQDNIEPPIGALLAHSGERPPRHNYLNPAWSRLMIRLGKMALPMLYFDEWRYKRYHARIAKRAVASTPAGEAGEAADRDTMAAERGQYERGQQKSAATGGRRS